jgi:hypothetical protein
MVKDFNELFEIVKARCSKFTLLINKELFMKFTGCIDLGNHLDLPCFNTLIVEL